MSPVIGLFTAVVLAYSPPPPRPGLVDEVHHGVRFVHRPRHAVQARQLAARTPQIGDRLARDLGIRALPPAEVRIAQSPDDLRELAPADSPPPAGALGVAYPSRGLAIVSLSAGASPLPLSLESLYTHELSHLALAEAVGHRPVPRWFTEGVAIRHSGELSWERLEALWGATIGGRLIPLSELDRRFPVEEHGASLAYAEAGDFVRFLAEDDRPDALAELCARIRQGVPFQAALEASYATRLSELERQFFTSLRNRFSIIPAITGVGAVWSLVALLLVLAWRRKRRIAKATLARWEIEERVTELASPPDEAAGKDAEAPRPDAPDRVYQDGGYHTLH